MSSMSETLDTAELQVLEISARIRGRAAWRPRGRLATYVREITTIDRDGWSDELLSLPDGEVDILFRLNGADRAFVPSAHVIGTPTHTHRKRVGDRSVGVAVRFRPGGAARFFGGGIAALNDQYVPLADCWGGEAAISLERLLTCDSVDRRVKTVERLLEQRLDACSEAANEAAIAVGVRLLSRPHTAVAEVAERVGLSPRTFANRFRDAVGLRPKAYQRVARFRSAVRLAAAAARPCWSAIAAETGYYDQAHMIGEFKALTGQPPTAACWRFEI
jgi:AraC-like DNA-binding protein